MPSFGGKSKGEGKGKIDVDLPSVSGGVKLPSGDVDVSGPAIELPQTGEFDFLPQRI